MIEEFKTNKTNKEIDKTIMDIIALMSNVKTRHLLNRRKENNVGNK